MQLRENCDITAKGRQLYAFINAIRQSEIICTKQYCSEDAFFCRVRSRDLSMLRTLASEYRIELQIQPHPSLLGMLKRYRLRLGIPLGLLFCTGIIFYYSNTIATIEIRGNDTVSDSFILSVLESCGVEEGTWISSIDFTRCERKLRAVVPGVAWAGIRHTGNRLVVEISEATPGVEMLQERTPCNIVSMYDAQITHVTIYNGHLVKLLGDGVAKGEMIVSGVFEDEKGHVTYHHAIASITGIYTKEAELTEYFTVAETEQTGKTWCRRYFRLFSLRIPLTVGSHGYEEFTETEADIPFSLFSHPLPFGIVQQTFTEKTTEVTVRTEEETRLALNAAIVRYEKNFLSDAEILDREITYTQNESGISCHITYTLEGEIGTTYEIFVK